MIPLPRVSLQSRANLQHSLKSVRAAEKVRIQVAPTFFSSCHVGHPFSFDSLSSLKHCKMFSIPKSVGETAVLQALMISVLLMPLFIRVSVIYHDIWFLAVILISKRETYLTGAVCLYSRIMPHNKSLSDPWFCLKAIFCYLKYNIHVCFFTHLKPCST